MRQPAMKVCRGWDGGICLGQVKIPKASVSKRCPTCQKEQRRLGKREGNRRLGKIWRLKKKKTETRWRERVIEVETTNPGRAELMQLARAAGLIKFKGV